MNLFISILIIAACSFLIAKVCDAFEVATSYLGRNMKEGIKGATLNAIGSSMPELLTTCFFLINHRYDPRIGHALAASFGGDTGSSIFNSIVIPIFVIATVVRLGQQVFINKKVILRDGLFLLGAEVILLVILSTSTITWIHGAVLTAYYLIYVGFLIYRMKVNNQEGEVEEYEAEDDVYSKWMTKNPARITLRAWLLLVASTLCLALLCDGLVIGAEMMATALNLPTLLVALVVVAAATSVPDTIISIKDAKKGNHDDSLSNVLGSNIFDISISAGLPMMIFMLVTGTTIPFAEAGPTLIDIRIGLLIITTITIGVFYFSKKLNWISIGILSALYIVFLGYALYSAGGGEQLVPEAVNHFLNSVSETIIPVK